MYANSFMCDLVAYEPGKPIEETARELGLKAEEIVKLASNENPLGPSPLAKVAMREALEKSHLYPDGGGWKLRQAIAKKHSVSLENIVLGNGSNEIIELLCHCYLRPSAGLIAAEHAFVVYQLMAKLFGANYTKVPDPNFIHDLPAMAAAVDENTRLIFVANPNNPTGTVVGQEQLDEFVASLPAHVVAVFDEAYYEFLPTPPDTLKYVREGRNVCVLRTFSKALGLAGLRIGYGITTPDIQNLLQKARQPFNVNAIAQAGALAAIDDLEHIAKTKINNAEGLAMFENEFRSMGLEFVPSVANFVLVKVGDGDQVFHAMLQQGVIVRAMSSYKLPEWVRITVGTPQENTRCIQALTKAIISIKC